MATRSSIPRLAVKSAALKTRPTVERRGPARKLVLAPGPEPVPLPVLRIGLGFDIHPLTAGRRMMIGGVEIPFEKGPAGHSDGDPLLHALTDALLGAAGLGDMGAHFPDTDPRWKGVSSEIFLRETAKGIAANNYEILNLDCNIILERPKLSPHIEAIRRHIASILDLSPEQVSVKAKRHEGLDSLGRNEAVSAQAVVLLVRR